LGLVGEVPRLEARGVPLCVPTVLPAGRKDSRLRGLREASGERSVMSGSPTTYPPRMRTHVSGRVKEPYIG